MVHKYWQISLVHIAHQMNFSHLPRVNLSSPTSIYILVQKYELYTTCQMHFIPNLAHTHGNDQILCFHKALYGCTIHMIHKLWCAVSRHSYHITCTADKWRAAGILVLFCLSWGLLLCFVFTFSLKYIFVWTYEITYMYIYL